MENLWNFWNLWNFRGRIPEELSKRLTSQPMPAQPGWRVYVGVLVGRGGASNPFGLEWQQWTVHSLAACSRRTSLSLLGSEAPILKSTARVCHSTL